MGLICFSAKHQYQCNPYLGYAFGEIRVELSDKAKRVFAEEAENVFMTHELLGQGLESRVNYPENTIGLNYGRDI
ncbi:hypothetical protein OQJ22_09630 [Legionella pneumophila]|uniref:hypothetical protein n=1 Tax=Legionella pneumophila TaxID=446 RepID=UPI002244EE17|nr:hypothetical protein [Legionella pneumophila]MCW8431933.1 hypothetical protein [Legionella pneumophila]HCE5342861.1 hypothetical protein [Legionella pneumophila]HCE5352073.1 hypothetical protein [Legionella pneumophila]HCE5361196.1 hypothetical protein [Legionella pneumophila]HCE5404008.1 hypothetical protein [Legionella pneumophila]